MARTRGKHAAPIPGDPDDPQGFVVLVEAFFTWMRVHNYSACTIGNRRTHLRLFARWCETRSVRGPAQITRPILERYQRHLSQSRTHRGRPLGVRTQQAHLTTLRAYFAWLAKQHQIPYNPASELELPRLAPQLPRHVLTEHEMDQVLRQPDISTPMGVRDRTILEVLYSTGIRRLELLQLTLYDVDREHGTLFIRQGKGGKDRVVPIGERALAWVDTYLLDVRPLLAVNAEQDTLFVTAAGGPISENRLTQIVHDSIEAADLGKHGACHLLRHSMATAMLERGADIRYIQHMLGHARLDSTQIYTQVSIRRLKAVHTATHPTALLARRDAEHDASSEPTQHEFRDI